MELPFNEVVILALLTLYRRDHSLDFVNEDGANTLLALELVNDVLAFSFLPFALPLYVIKEEAFLHVFIIASTNLFRELLRVHTERIFFLLLLLLEDLVIL